MTVETLTVEDAEGVRETGKKIGRYVTVSDPGMAEDSDPGALSREIAAELEKLIGASSGKDPREGVSVLVAGLGNRFITPDALGARCADKIPASVNAGPRGKTSVAVISPGVLYQTGMESADIIRAVAAFLSPDVVIAIDAMAARSTSRLASTVQLSDTGLSPGRGIGNNRPGIDRAGIGFPVISVGVPTVVSSSTLIFDALRDAGTEEITPELEKILERERGFFVTLGDSDRVTERLSDVISHAVMTSLGTLPPA